MFAAAQSCARLDCVPVDIPLPGTKWNFGISSPRCEVDVF